MAQSKLLINLSQGLIEAEGEEAFVLKVYEDFKERLSAAEIGDIGGSGGGDRGDNGKSHRPRRAALQRSVAWRRDPRRRREIRHQVWLGGSR